jgi:hypothetical protein
MKKITVNADKWNGIPHGGWGQAGALEVALSTFGAHFVVDAGGFHLNKNR